MLGTLLSGRGYKKLIAALGRKQAEPAEAVVIHRGINITYNYYSREDGKHHSTIEGRGTVASPLPPRIQTTTGPVTAPASLSKRGGPDDG